MPVCGDAGRPARWRSGPAEGGSRADQPRTGRHARPPFAKAYSFGLVTGAFFLISWLGQFIYQMMAERNDAEQHGQAFTHVGVPAAVLLVHLRELAVRVPAAQLAGRRAGVVLLLGSSQSKEGEDRVEAKIDRLLREINVDPSEFDDKEEQKADGEQSGHRRST